MGNKPEKGGITENSISDKPLLLVIDDDEGLSRLIRKVFSREGYRTEGAANGKDAVDKVKANADVLLLLDYKLTDMTGMELINAFRQQGLTPPFIIMTGYGDEKIAVEMMKTGARDYVVKGPGFIDFIPRVVERVISELEVEKKLKSAEKSLIKSEESFRAIFEKSATAIGLIDMSRNVIKINPAFAAMFGWTQEELAGRNVSEISFPDDDIMNIRLYKEIIEGRLDHFQMEKRYIHKNGTIIWGLLTVTMIRDIDSNPEFIVGMIEDITERKKAEAAILEQMVLSDLSAEIGKALTMEDSLQGMLKQCCQSIVDHLNAAFARIWLLEHDEKVLELKASAGMYVHIDGKRARIPIDGNTKIAHIALYGKPQLTNSVIGDPQILDQEWAKREGLIAFAGHPLIIDNKVIGVMAMFSRSVLSEVVMKALASIADEIAVGIQRKTSEEALRTSRDSFTAVLDSLEALVYVADMQTYEVLYLNRFGKDLFGNIEGKICYKTLQANQSSPCSFCTNNQLLTPDGRPAEIVRWEIQNTVNGRWYDIRDRAIEWVDGRTVRLEIATDITERKMMEKKLEDVAISDELTGLLNRRGFFTFAENHFNIANRKQTELTLLFIDLDGMKDINDELGHKTGDLALMDTADLLRKSFRASDIIARIGGDEFAVLLTEPQESGTTEVIADHLQGNFSLHNKHAGRPFELLVSIGAARYNPQAPCSVDELLSRADTLMYEEKRHHKLARNRVISFGRSGTDKRRYIRFNTDGFLTAELSSFNVRIRNLSEGGISVRTPERLSMDSTYEIRISGMANEDVLLTGTVSWTSLHPSASEDSIAYYDAGLKFISLDDEKKDTLLRFIQKLEALHL